MCAVQERTPNVQHRDLHSVPERFSTGHIYRWAKSDFGVFVVLYTLVQIPALLLSDSAEVNADSNVVVSKP